MCCQRLSNNTKDIKKEIYIEFPKIWKWSVLMLLQTFFKRGCEKEMETLGLVVAIYLCKFIF